MFKKLWIILFLVALTLSSVIPLSANADEISYPKEINGYPVIFVQTPENTCTLNTDEVIITLLDKSAVSVEDSVSQTNLAEYLKKNPLPQGWSIEVYGGPGASSEEYLKVHEQNNKILAKLMREHPEVLERSAPTDLKFSSQKSSVPLISRNPATYSIVQNDDPSSQVIVGQKVRWYAPYVGTSSNNTFSAFLNNGMTNTGYFIQVGQAFTYGAGTNIWADSSTGYVPVAFTLAYVPMHLYEFYFFYNSGLWLFWCNDITTGGFNYYLETRGTGTRLVTQTGTSVFFENQNRGAGWWNGFSYYISAFLAQDFVTQWKYWNLQEIHIMIPQEIPNNGIITGSLVNGGTASWYLPNIPLAP